MTETELLEYYKTTKNSCDEIKLMSKGGQIAYIFRHYTEYYTNKDYWLSLKTGTLFDYKSLSVFYEIPNSYNIFKSLKLGDVILALSKGCDAPFYFKKIDDDAFIECEIDGKIETRVFPPKDYDIMDSEEITSFLNVVKKINKGGKQND